MSSLLTVRRAGRMLLTEFTITPDGAIRERFPDDSRCNRLLIYGLEGEMFFGASAALEAISSGSSSASTGTRARWSCDSSALATRMPPA
jgi:hypothetical protein